MDCERLHPAVRGSAHGRCGLRRTVRTQASPDRWARLLRDRLAGCALAPSLPWLIAARGDPGRGCRHGGACSPVVVRNGKGETSREVPLLDVTVREAVKEWKAERSEWPGAGGQALFLNRYRGGRLSARAVDQLLDELATEADLVDEAGAPAASAHTLRHTFGTSLLRQGVDIVVVAELLGHARLDTTRRYTLPTHGDLETAVAKLPTDQ